MKLRPEVNNIEPVRQNDTLPKLPNDDKQPTLPNLTTRRRNQNTKSDN